MENSRDFGEAGKNGTTVPDIFETRSLGTLRASRRLPGRGDPPFPFVFRGEAPATLRSPAAGNPLRCLGWPHPSGPWALQGGERFLGPQVFGLGCSRARGSGRMRVRGIEGPTAEGASGQRAPRQLGRLGLGWREGAGPSGGKVKV